MKQAIIGCKGEECASGTSTIIAEKLSGQRVKPAYVPNEVRQCAVGDTVLGHWIGLSNLTLAARTFCDGPIYKAFSNHGEATSILPISAGLCCDSINSDSEV